MRSRSKLIRFVVICFFFALSAAVFSRAMAFEVKLYSYHNTPPFVTGPEEGLTFDLVDYLNRNAEQRFVFDVQLVPRKRLDHLLAMKSDIVVPWVSPAWFKPGQQDQFNWSEPVLTDGNIYLSPIARPVEVETPRNIYGLTLGGVLGHRYVGLEEAFSSGEVSRMNAPNERSLVQLVAHGRVDVAVLAESTARFLVHDLGLVEKVHFGKYRHSVYARRLLVNGHLPEVVAFLRQVVRNMATDPVWHEILNKYHQGPDSSEES